MSFSDPAEAMIQASQSSPHCPDGSSHSAATLSIVLVSAGLPEVRSRAARLLLASCASPAAQMILVTTGDADPSLFSYLRRRGVTLVPAPTGSTRAEMCDLGMRHVTGSIVAVRDDSDVGDGSWLQAFRRLVPDLEVGIPGTAELAASVGRERVVMDSLAPAGRPAGDAVAPRPLVDLVRTPPESFEMAAIM